MEIKKQLRQAMTKKLEQLPDERYHTLSTNITEKLIEQPDWKKTTIVGATISRKPEVDTYSLIKKAWNEGKRIVVPKTIKETKMMDFYEIESFEQLENTYFGLKEPKVDMCKKISPDYIEYLLVPGLAFDKKGYRLGFGGGYYDRFLANYNGKTCALAFDFQVIEEIPVNDYDLPVEVIITDKRVYR
ncbi:5-formyltetrahydrofolate cyclo-ligase [Bacillus sp. FJAT-45350]|uniref:5-formyltetrahydrofolate cyclo-ligase n=1 Tax=Bacillus sp. FJAT-45350 TaxID=2011014 RepID=UPI0015CE490B|nr:5-formyltetrahydrofolate cyclo-ligase [Bacillus sp. FJAT-45350]